MNVKLYFMFNVLVTHCCPNTGIIDEISEEAALLTMLAESISLLDMIVNSFAFMVSSKDMGNYSRPEFTGLYTFCSSLLFYKVINFHFS